MKKWLDAYKVDVKKNRTKIIIISFVFLFLFIYAVSVYFSAVDIASRRYNANIDTVVDKNPQSIFLMPETEVTQTFIAHDNVAGISLLFGQMNHNLEGSLHVKLVDVKNNRDVYSWEVALNELIFDEPDKDLNHPFLMDEPLHIQEGKEYKIIISTAGQQSENDAIPLIFSDGDTYVYGAGTIGGEDAGADVCFRVLDSENSFMIPVYWIFVALIFIALIIVSFIILRNQFRIEHLFLLSVLCIGSIYMFLMTPLSVPDEPAHFDTAYQYSNVFLFKGSAPGENRILMRSEDAEFLKEFGNRPTIKGYHYLSNNILDKADEDSLVQVRAQLVKTTPYVYFPAAIGIMTGRMLGLGTAMVFFMGRFANLIAFALAGFLSIRKIPFGKMVIFVVGLLPMTMQQVSSYSYDAVVFGLSFLFISYCLHAAFDKEELKIRDIIILSILGVFIAPAKAVYVCLILLVFLIPKERFSTLRMRGNKKAKSLACVLGASFISFMAFNIANIIVNYVTVDTTVLSYGDVPGYTVSYLFSHLGKFLLLIRRTIFYELSYYFESMLGKYLGWLNLEISGLLMYAFFAILILAAVKDDHEKVHLTLRNKILITFITGSVFALVCAAMLLSFTPITSGVIMGVQGRYFLPVLPLALLLFRTDKFVLKKDISSYMIFAVWILQIFTVAYVFQWVLYQI